VGSNKISGVISARPVHLNKDKTKACGIDDLVIDIGAENKQQAQELDVLGQQACFDSEFYVFGDGLVKAKALDDRMGCAVMLEVMGSLMADRPTADLDLYFCFTVREEIGLSGARTAAEKIAPHLAIVLESTAVGDLPDAPYHRRVANLGKGGVLSVMDRSTIYDRPFVDFALRVAKEGEIPVQVKRYVSGGNDAGSIHKSGTGVRSLALSVPTRYLHSPSCVINLEDYRSTKRLTEAMLRGLRHDMP
jgi:endoglucanase